MTISAGLGLAGFPFNDASDYWAWVKLCDEGGVNSLWQSDRLISRDPQLETMSVMAALAGATKRIKFGMNVASLGLRDPIVTAKACATIDFLSGGRLLPMFGVGSARSPDFRATGKPTAGRGTRTNEAVQIMTRLWSEDDVDFEGEHYQLKGATISPKPAQKRLPLWLGGSSKAAIERTARWSTGWQAGIENAEDVKPVIEAIKAACDVHGTSIDEDHYGAGFGFYFGDKDNPVVQKQMAGLAKLTGKPADGFFAVGGADEILNRIRDFHTAGAHKFVLRPIAANTAEVMEQTQALIEQVLPELTAMNRS